MNVHVPTPAPHPIAAPRQAGDLDRIIGRRIRTLRDSRRLSQANLGAAVGVTRQQIQQYENGTSRIGAARLWEIACLLDVPVASFFADGGAAEDGAP